MTDHPPKYVVPAGAAPLVHLKGIAKSFPGVIANEDVDLEVMPGEIHALLGENGAGKSTLMNILTGIYQADAGEIMIDGYVRQFASPQQAIAAGIGMVHQHFKLVEAFTVAENIHLGWKQTPRRASAAVLEARTASLAKKFNLEVKGSARITEMSTGEQQRVEILRVLARNARLLILDEPTSSLDARAEAHIFDALRTLMKNRTTFVIAHRLSTVRHADKILVLDGGRVAGFGNHEENLESVPLYRELCERLAV